MRRILPLLATIAATGAAPAAAAPGPPLRTPVAQLEAALECSPGIERSARPPVILVHGTTSTPEENWGAGYRKVLPQRGWPACTVRLPDRAMNDLQRAVEPLVHAIRTVSARRGGPVSLLGHSQGGLHVVYAQRFWPDLAAKVDDTIGLGPPNGVVRLGDSLCRGGCQAAFWQVTTGAKFSEAFRARRNPAGMDLTSVITLSDEIIFPQPESSTFAGASNVVLQSVCPNNSVDHFALAVDGESFAVVMDALQHRGPADPGRLPLTVCAERYLPGVGPAEYAAITKTAMDGVGEAQDQPKLDAEPALRCYMDASCTDPDERGRVVSSMVVRRGRLRLTTQGAGDVRVELRRRGRAPRTWAPSFAAPGTRSLALPRGRNTVTVSARPAGDPRFLVERRLVARR